MSGLTQHDVLVAVIGALVGAIITAIPAWITVSQVRRTRLKTDVNDAVNAKIGDLVGGAFTNLLTMQRDAETNLTTLRIDLESRAATIRQELQAELDTILADARTTLDDLQRVAERAKKSASEIDEVKESATALGIDLDKLAELGEARQEREYLGFFKARRAEYLSNLQTLFEQLRLPDEDRDHDKLEGIIALANAADAEDAKGKLAVEIKSAERLIEAFESHISSRQDEVANEVITDAHIADQE